MHDKRLRPSPTYTMNAYYRKLGKSEVTFSTDLFFNAVWSLSRVVQLEAVTFNTIHFGNISEQTFHLENLFQPLISP